MSKTVPLFKESSAVLGSQRSLELKIRTRQAFYVMLNGKRFYVPAKSDVYLPAHLVTCRSDVRLASNDPRELNKLAEDIDAFVKARKFSRDEEDVRLATIGAATLARFQASEITAGNPDFIPAGHGDVTIMETV